MYKIYTLGAKMLFKYGTVATGRYFYDRSKMQREIEFFLKGGQSFMIKAPRRYGKTSLIENCLQINKLEYFYADFRKTPRVEIFNNKLIEYIYSRLGLKGAIKQLQSNAVAFLREHKSTISIDVSLFEASVELFSSSVVSQEERLIEALDMTQKIAKELNTTFYIVFDEFQDVKRLSTSGVDLLELMRGVMQHHEDVCYVFAGSHMTLMTEIFENKKSPFFNFCRKFKLDAFDTDELLGELLEAFKSRGILFESDALLKDVLARLKGHPANTMLVMQFIESMASREDVKLIKKELVELAYEKAHEELQDLINEYLKEIKTKEHLHDVIYRLANGEKQVLEPSSLRQKRAYLVDMGYISRVGRGEYEIIDGFLEEELKESL